MNSAFAAAAALLILLPRPAAAQVPLFVSGALGGSYDIDDRDPQTGGGFGFLTGVGLRFKQVAFGAEFGQHALGGDRKARQYGAFIRLPAGSGGPVRPYLVAGVADYRYSPTTGSKRHALGGSVGPGATFALGSWHASAILEARFHSSFDQLAAVSSQEFLSIMAGLQLSL